jgi:hypothetical protein
MSKLLQTLTVISAIILPVVGSSDQLAIAQERQGCYMVNDRGALLDLSEICPSPTFVVTETTTEGLGTGDIQVTLRWASTDDLDLEVIDPNGDTVAYYNPSIPSGGQLDVDANAACGGTTTQPIENVFWPISEAPSGSYTIRVNLFARCDGSTGAIPFEVRLLTRGNIETLSGSVDDASTTSSFPFSLD